MKKNRIQQDCKVCGGSFECRPCEIGHIVTCSKGCSLAYRSINATGRAMTWSDKIHAARAGKAINLDYITPEYRERQRQLAKINGLGSYWKGKKLSKEHAEKIAAAHQGHKRGGWKLSDEARNAMSERFKGDKSTFWRGGLASSNAIARSSAKYKDWRKSVFDRDNYTCCECGARGVKLNADHIKPFALYEELRYELSNGRTLCVPCHKKTDTYGRRTRHLAKALHGIDVRLTA